ncbi:MAG: hypothetical protein J6V11_02305 [Alphaproteobacteria bacterium]|nr:hypothetical protein [Alphaproteobacteria bacterium]
MENHKADLEKYAYIQAETPLKTPQEVSVWMTKLLSNMFVRYLVYNNIDPDKEKLNYRMADIKHKFAGDTIFSAALKTGYHEQAAHYIHAMKSHPDFKKSLNLSDTKTVEALKALFDATPKKMPKVRTATQIAHDKEAERQKQKLRYVLTRVLSPLTIMRDYMGKENETAFSAAIKLGDTRSAYKALQQVQSSSQEEILKQLNLTDEETKTTLRNITHPHETHKHYRILTAKLQQILTQANFVEQVRGKTLFYQDRQNLMDDDQDRITTPITTTNNQTYLWEHAKKQGRGS